MYRLLACITILLASSLGSLAQQLPDPPVIFSESRQRLLADLERLPRYTCVQTITRHYYSPPFRWMSSGSCKEIIEQHDRRNHELTERGWDRLRLDIAVLGSHEVFSWVGAPRFEEGSLAEVAGSGPLGSGDFGPFIGGIFKAGTVKLEGEQLIQGRRVLEYSYVVPKSASKYQIDVNKKEKFISGYSGSLFLDRDDPDLVRLTVRTGELPAQTGKCQANSEIDYGRVLIHGREALIPRETRLRVIGREGDEALNVASYADCHEYSSTSVVRFDPVESGGSGPTVSSPPPPSPIPAGVHFDWRLISLIDSDTAAAGDGLEAILRSPIRDKKGAVLVPAGNHIHGRLLQLGENSARGYFEISLKFESIDMNGTPVPFYAKLEGDNIWAGGRFHLPLTLNALNGSAWFYFRSRHLKIDHLDSSGTTTLPPTKEEKTAGSSAAK